MAALLIFLISAAVSVLVEKNRQDANLNTALAEMRLQIVNIETRIDLLEKTNICEHPPAPIASEEQSSPKTAADEKEPIEQVISGEWNIGEAVPLPDLPSDAKFVEDFRRFDILGSPHYRLQQCCTTDEYGCRRFGEDYVVGLGAFYSTSIGDRFKVTLDTGNEFTIILGDNKSDTDTDDTNRYTPYRTLNALGEEVGDGANILEFIVDIEAISAEAYHYGGVSYYEHLRGNVTEMVYIGRDESGDWDTWY